MGAELDANAREKLLQALAAGANVSGAAKASGYSRIHVHRLLKEPSFLAEVEKVRAKGVPEPEDVRAAKAVLVQIMNGEIEATAPELAVRVSAAKAVIATFQTRARQAAGPGAMPQAADPIKILPPEEGKAQAEAWLQSQA